MFKQRCLAVVLISILFIAPLANLNDPSRHETLADRSISESDTLTAFTTDRDTYTGTVEPGIRQPKVTVKGTAASAESKWEHEYFLLIFF